MHVVIVNDFASVNGGSSAVAFAGARALAARGHRVTVFAAVPPVDPAAEADGVAIRCLGQPTILDNPDRRAAMRDGLWNRTAARALAEFLDDPATGADVVHLHSWSKALSTSVVPPVLRRRLPLFVTLHDYFYSCPNGGHYDYPAGAICHRRPLSAACVLRDCDVRSYVHKGWRVLRQVIQNGPGHMRDPRLRVVCVSDFSHRVVAPFLPSGTRVDIVPNPIEVARGPAARPADNQALTFVGRLEPEKGPTLFANAAAPLDRPVVFVGEGRCRDEVAAACPRAELTSWLPRAEVNERLRRARALVFPSLLAETQGMSVLEAAAAGIPAVVGDASAATDFVTDGETGLRFRMGDAEDLRRVLRLLDDDGLVARLGRTAYDRFWSLAVSPADHAARLEALYRDAVATAPRPPSPDHRQTESP